MFLEISENSQENTYARASQKLLHKYFPVKFGEISKNTFFTEHLWTTISEKIYIIDIWQGPKWDDSKIASR